MPHTTARHLMAVTTFVAMSTLTACGGGSNDEVEPDTPPVTGRADTTRVSVVSMDLDNDGTADATETTSYDNAGRPVETRYVYAGDSAPDRFEGLGTQDETTTFAYDTAGRVSSVTTAGTSFSFVFGDAGVPLHADVATTGLNGRVDFTHDAAGRMTRAETSLNGTATGIDAFEYDADGRRTRELETGPGDSSGVETVYGWNDDGTLATVERDLDADGTDVRYEMSYENGRQTSTRKSVGGVLRYAVRFEYDSDGRLAKAIFDVGGDGSDDAVWTLSWQAGACRVITLPIFDPLIDSNTGHNSTSTGTVGRCAEG